MNKIFFKAFFITLLSVIHIGSALLNNFDNSEKDLGDVCYLKDNKRGSCEEIMKCDHAKELFRSKRTSEIVNCRFKGKVPLVCCPTLEKPSTFEQILCKTKKSQGTKNARIGEISYHVALGFKNKNGTVEIKCSGSLIADNIVLTVAACVDMNGSVPVIATLGTSPVLNDTWAQHIAIEAVKIHPEYSNVTKQNDIALIKLKQPANLSEVVDTICLSFSDDKLPKELNMIDFAIPNLNKTESWLFKGTTHQESLQKCKTSMSKIGIEILDSQICVLIDSENNNSLKVAGNPISYEENNSHFLYGITTYGIATESLNAVVYTKVNKYISWIESEMEVMK
ncbi:unnamed protein product [Chironomus riparius]|uniref:CLIP domain-containing serine protease n=1 Tax=Chironomus riparius TaxID=315576 RepID=A0A9N9WNZ5_9DIPT|nr:unnamed protein product [Chironomus riparius]